MRFRTGWFRGLEFMGMGLARILIGNLALVGITGMQTVDFQPCHRRDWAYDVFSRSLVLVSVRMREGGVVFKARFYGLNLKP